MTIRLRKFDAADFLNNAEDIAVYLSVALEEDGFGAFMDALGTVARSRGMTDIARKTGRSRESLYKSLRATGNPSFEVIGEIMNALDLQLMSNQRMASARKLRKNA